MRNPKSICLMVTSEITAVTFYKGYLQFLRRGGWDVTVVGSSSGRLEQLAEEEGVSAFNLAMQRDPAPAQDLRSLAQAVLFLWRAKPEVVVAATPKAGLLGMIAARLTGVPIRVYQLWGLRLETEHGLRRRIFTVLERLACALATQVVANSRSLAEEAIRLRLSPTVEVLGPGSSHGVDLAHFDPERVDIPPADQRTLDQIRGNREAIVIGYVGRVHRDKGVEILLEAVLLVAEKGRPITLLVIGPIEDDILERRLSANLVPNLNIVMVGSVDDPRPYFLLMDIHVLPTRREGFPNVVLEAAALGIPTITTLATGARDSVVHQTTGVLVPVDDPYSMSIEIENLALDTAKREEYSVKAKLHAAANFERTAIFRLQERNLTALRAANISYRRPKTDGGAR